MPLENNDVHVYAMRLRQRRHHQHAALLRFAPLRCAIFAPMLFFFSPSLPTSRTTPPCSPPLPTSSSTRLSFVTPPAQLLFSITFSQRRCRRRHAAAAATRVACFARDFFDAAFADAFAAAFTCRCVFFDVIRHDAATMLPRRVIDAAEEIAAFRRMAWHSHTCHCPASAYCLRFR